MPLLGKSFDKYDACELPEVPLGSCLFESLQAAGQLKTLKDNLVGVFHRKDVVVILEAEAERAGCQFGRQFGGKPKAAETAGGTPRLYNLCPYHQHHKASLKQAAAEGAAGKRKAIYASRQQTKSDHIQGSHQRLRALQSASADVAASSGIVASADPTAAGSAAAFDAAEIATIAVAVAGADEASGSAACAASPVGRGAAADASTSAGAVVDASMGTCNVAAASPNAALRENTACAAGASAVEVALATAGEIEGAAQLVQNRVGSSRYGDDMGAAQCAYSLTLWDLTKAVGGPSQWGPAAGNGKGKERTNWALRLLEAGSPGDRIAVVWTNLGLHTRKGSATIAHGRGCEDLNGARRMVKYFSAPCKEWVRLHVHLDVPPRTTVESTLPLLDDCRQRV